MSNIYPKMQLTPAFMDSYSLYAKYPLRMASKGPYTVLALAAYHNRLDEHAPKLFIGTGDESFVVPFRDIVKDAEGTWQIRKWNALDEQKLKLKLGDTTHEDPMDPTKLIAGSFATEPDPRCRLMLVYPLNQLLQLLICF